MSPAHRMLLRGAAARVLFNEPEVLVAAALTQFHSGGEVEATPSQTGGSDPFSPWRIGNSFRLGISGVPGVGKSTFIETLGLFLIELGHRVVDLGQTAAWAPSKDRAEWGWWLWWGRWVFAALGWLVTALGAGAVTGVIQKNSSD